MAAKSSNIDVIIDVDKTNTDVPSCPHGPTLLFEQYDSQGKQRRFFACSAFRDRKLCNFFQWEDETISSSKQEVRKQIQESLKPKFSHKEFQKRLKKFCMLPESDRCLCQTCGVLLLPGEATQHESHNFTTPVTKKMLRTPSYLLTPLENNKTYAQYLFADSTVSFVIKTLQSIATHVLCVGAPRIFEAVRNLKENKMECMLLDLDHRYEQFLPPGQFCRFNMFNHHFFDGEESETNFCKFLKEHEEKKVVIVTDPPFGGMVEALAATFKTMIEKWRILSNKSSSKQLPILWFFPYFMEKRILECIPEFVMLDYKVAYDNHCLFGGNTKNRCSPVRIFTNLPASQVALPSDQGYRYCHVCKRYSAEENLHCDVCDICPSKNGKTYRHCFKCDRCVKPSTQHCDTCQMCQLPDHQCGSAKSAGCHICGDLSHKRRNCPNKGTSTKQINNNSKKRKQFVQHKSKAKKKKK